MLHVLDTTKQSVSGSFDAASTPLRPTTVIIQAVVNGRSLSNGQAHLFLNWVVQEGRKSSFAPHALCISLLKNLGLKPTPFLSNRMKGHTVNHGALTLGLQVNQSEKIYLIDPGFHKFYDPCDPKQDGQLLPGFLLANRIPSDTGIVKHLAKAGYVPLTPAFARHYMAVFTGGKSRVRSVEAAYAYMHSPR